MLSSPGTCRSSSATGATAPAAHDAAVPTQAMLEAIGDAVVSAGVDGRVTYMNPAAQAMTGWTLVEAIGQLLADVVRVKDAADRSHQMLVRRTGEEIAVERTTAPMRDARGLALGSVTVCRDAGARVASSQALSHRALHDALTGLPNRLLLMERLADALACGQRGGHPVAVCFLDVDGLKAVNDAFGHHVGDAVLTAVAKRLIEAVRSSDTVSRVGGDEFVVVLPHVAHRTDAAHLSRTISHWVCQPLRSHGVMIQVGASIGLALTPDDGRTPAALIARADQAMYEVKRTRARRRAAPAATFMAGPVVSAAAAARDGRRAW